MPIQTSELTRFLCDLVRIDTTNPPGNELPAAQYVANVLREAGIDPVILESAPGRGNVIARLKGDGSARPMLLMSHLDVVPAEPKEWSHPPFQAELADGCIWGRGCMDCKVLTAMQLGVLLALKRDGVPLHRDVILAATADEEAGGELGMQWLVEQHPSLLDAEYAINEGGGFGLQFGQKRFYLVDSGEKGVCWIKLTAHGTPGHGSMPHSDNAVVKLSAALTRLGGAMLPHHRTRSVERMLHIVGQEMGLAARLFLPLLLSPTIEPVIQRMLAKRGQLGPALRAVLHNTVSPTVVRAGSKTNVIPAEAGAEVDGRLLPGQTPDDLLREIRPIIGPEIEAQVIKHGASWESEPASPLFDVFVQVLGERDPGCVVLPFLMPGASDGRFLAERGVRVYGFSPMRQEPGMNLMQLMHAPDERISEANLEFGADVLYDVLKRFV